jgi:hypothetical protein
MCFATRASWNGWLTIERTLPSGAAATMIHDDDDDGYERSTTGEAREVVIDLRMAFIGFILHGNRSGLALHG